MRKIYAEGLCRNARNASNQYANWDTAMQAAS